jgi:predicted transposase YdaD
MKTYKQIYKIFETVPSLFFELLDITTESEYNMTSESVKDINCTMDGLFKPNNPNEIHYVFEFQAQPTKDIFQRLFIEVAALSRHNPDRVYHGIIIFISRNIDQPTEPWSRICQIEGSGFQVFYLDELLEKLAKRSPEHPLLALFAPLFEKDGEALAKKAAVYYHQIGNAKLKPQQRGSLEAVLIDWFMLYFTKKSKKEIFAMFALEGSIEDSVAYQEIINIGRLEGRKSGKKIGKEMGEKIGMVTGKLSNLKELHAEGEISDRLFQERSRKYQHQLDKLLKKYDQPVS